MMELIGFSCVYQAGSTDLDPVFFFFFVSVFTLLLIFHYKIIAVENENIPECYNC